MSYTYIAGPYTHSDKLVMKARFKLNEFCTVMYLKQKQFVYSPIVHCHQMAQDYRLPVDFDFWKHYNYAMLKPAGYLRILAMPDWKMSKGVQAEKDFAVHHKIRLELIEWEAILQMAWASGDFELRQYCSHLERNEPARSY